MITFKEIADGQKDDYATGCFRDYQDDNSRSNYPKAIQKITFTLNLDQQATMFFFSEESNETILHFSNVTVRVLQICFALI